MTQNQINYARVREEERHNRATEGYANLELSETSRHNQQTEATNWYSAQEGARHNVAAENLNWYTAPSTVALNLARATESENKVTLNQLYYDLDLSKFEEQKWKDLWSTWNDSKRVAMAQQELDEQINKWMRDYNLEAAKWYDSLQGKTYAETIREQVAAGKDMIQIITSVAKLVAMALG